MQARTSRILICLLVILSLSAPVAASGHNPPDLQGTPSQPVPPPASPIQSGLSWSDEIMDSYGFNLIANSSVTNGYLSLSQVVPLGRGILTNDVETMAAANNGKLLLGTYGATLYSYNPANGEMINLGGPVPAECFT
jgi:hypothetical protein